MPSTIDWPDRYRPDRTPVHVRNEIVVAAPPERVWAWLVRAPLWPTWYPNSQNVRILAGNEPTLRRGTEFAWRTFGVGIRSTVLEFQPPARIAWNAFGLGVDAYHAWLIEPVAGGTRILTEETQYGWAARMSAAIFPARMRKFHQVWLEELGRKALAGLPPG
jgi:uncharacterized protein YndB with AHSA1/START domain